MSRRSSRIPYNYLNRSLYYEETLTLGERIFVVGIGLLISPILLPLLNVVSGFVVYWLWTVTLIGFLAYVMTQIAHLFLTGTILGFHWARNVIAEDNDVNLGEAQQPLMPERGIFD